MTREEAHQRLHFGNKLDYLSFNELHLGIEEIFDDFESRTCDNCIYNSKEDGYCKWFESFMAIKILDGSGCGKFKGNK